MSVEELTRPATTEPGPSRRSAIIALAVVAVVATFLLIAALARRSDASLAQLRLRDDNVDVRSGNADFTDGLEGQRLARGDLVRTDRRGQAQIDYFDGSLTRLDSNTEFTINEIADRPEGRNISIELNAGRALNRVTALTSSDDRYAMRAGNAIATVRGTTNLVDALRAPNIAVVGFEDFTELVTTTGNTMLIGPFDCGLVTPNGEIQTCDASDFIDQTVLQWLIEYGLDESLPQPEETEEPVEETPSPTPAPVRRRTTTGTAATTPPTTATPTRRPPPTVPPRVREDTRDTRETERPRRTPRRTTPQTTPTQSPEESLVT